MKSTLYKKYRRSKYTFRTKIIKGTRGPGGKVVAKGECKPGWRPALADVEKQLGRPLNLHHTEHTVGEWVFCELKP